MEWRKGREKCPYRTREKEMSEKKCAKIEKREWKEGKNVAKIG